MFKSYLKAEAGEAVTLLAIGLFLAMVGLWAAIIISAIEAKRAEIEAGAGPLVGGAVSRVSFDH